VPAIDLHKKRYDNGVYAEAGKRTRQIACGIVPAVANAIAANTSSRLSALSPTHANKFNQVQHYCMKKLDFPVFSN